MTIQRYILGASPTKQTAMIQPFDDKGHVTGEFREFNAGIVYIADEADARISELERALKSCSTVLSQMLKKDEALAGVAREALAEADRALVVSGGNPHAGK